MSQQTWVITAASSGFGRQLNEIRLVEGRVAATARKPAVERPQAQ